MYYSLAALHVSSDIFAHHQEYRNCIYSFWYYSRMSLPAGVMDELELQFQLIHDRPTTTNNTAITKLRR
jgi:hypothetical protein